MLELLDTGRMAHRFGKWRGLVAAANAVVLFLLALLISKLEGLIVFSSPKPTITSSSSPVLGWISIGLLMVGGLLWLWASWQLYRDHIHSDYYLEAEHFKNHGW